METIVFKTEKGNAATDSLKVAAKFGKRHAHVLRDIRAILANRAENKREANVPKIGPNAEGAIFHPWGYTDGRGRGQEMYLLNRAAFSLLVMGFTGKKAAAFKEEYVSEFDRMESALRSFENDAPINLLDHARREVQVANSKSINNYQYLLGGVASVVEYNRENCRLHTGKYPHQLKAAAKERGVPAKIRSSAKELLRHESPETTCAMSLADEMVRRGATLSAAAAVTLGAREVFAGLLRLGFQPTQLSQ